MNSADFISRVASNPDDLQELRQCAADLAHESARQSVEALGEVRRGLAALEPSSEAGRAYLLAMRDFLSGIESAKQAEQAARAQQDRAAVREAWRPILAALAERPLLPSEIAEELGIDKAQVSRELKAMRAEELVEVYATAGEDARTRRHRLTAAGLTIAERLSPLSPAIETSARALVSYVTHIYSVLVTNQRLSAFDASALATRMLEGTRVDPAWAWRRIQDEARQNGLASLRDGVWHPSIDDNQQLRRKLKIRLSQAAKACALPDILQRAFGTAADERIFVRSSRTLDGAWRSCAGTLEAADAQRITVITDGDMTVGDADSTPGCLLFYDSLRQLHMDLQGRKAAVRRLAEPASVKACIVDAPSHLIPDGYLPVRLDA